MLKNHQKTLDKWIIIVYNIYIKLYRGYEMKIVRVEEKKIKADDIINILEDNDLRATFYGTLEQDEWDKKIKRFKVYDKNGYLIGSIWDAELEQKGGE